jgi:hypothetical protein
VLRHRLVEVSVVTEMETAHSFRSCKCDRPPSLVPHCAGWVGVIGMWDQPSFVASGTLHGSGGEKAGALSTPLINLGVGSEPSLRLSFMA